MKAHLIDAHLLVQRVSANVKVKYQGHISKKKKKKKKKKKVGGGELGFHKHILFSLFHH